LKKPKSLETKLRSAIRLIWSRSPERREIIRQAQYTIDGIKMFTCPGTCKKAWPIQMAEVDHIEPVGVLELDHLTEWVKKMFYSPQRVICKLCHRKKTAQDRKKMRMK
jgi:hypothetical protein